MALLYTPAVCAIGFPSEPLSSSSFGRFSIRQCGILNINSEQDGCVDCPIDRMTEGFIRMTHAPVENHNVK